MNRGANTLTDIMSYAFLVAGAFVLTKPGGTGATFVKNFSGGLIGLVQGASGQAVTAT